MAISKKDAKAVIASMRLSGMSQPQIHNLLETLKDAKIKNKSFRKSLKRISKVLAPKKSAAKKAA